MGSTGPKRWSVLRDLSRIIVTLGLVGGLVAGVGCDQVATNVAPNAMAAEATQGNIIRGRVVRVTDGDTLTVLDERNEQLTIRLAEIDAPERGQPWGNRSKQALSSRVMGKMISVQQTTVDRWGRSIGQVAVDGRDINREMISSGAAWAFRQYLSDQSLIEIEARAKHEKLGLWSMPEAQTVPPWEWRRGTRAAQVDPPALRAQQSLLSQEAVATAGDFTCGTKSRCGQMTSCEEANFYLTQCGVDTLDGNRDGEPCEKLCGTVGR